MHRRKRPIGIRTFAKIPEADHYYVDKTDRRIEDLLRINREEFKVVELEPKGLALQQIKDRGYADKYRALGQPIHLIGIEFSRERRGPGGFEVETL